MTLIKKQSNIPVTLKDVFYRNAFMTPLDDIFTNFFDNNFPDFGIKESFVKSSYPKVNIKDYADKIILEAEIGGLTKDNVHVIIKDDTLTISGSKKYENDKQEDDNNFKYIKREISNSSFQRSFIINETLDKESISAEFKDGLLIISINKAIPQNNEKIINIV